MGTLLVVAPDVERLAEKLRVTMPASGAVSCWNGKLIARVVAGDGYQLKKAMAGALTAVLAGKPLPKAWAL
jgi:urease accessory protein